MNAHEALPRDHTAEKRAWQPMKINYLGDVSELVLGWRKTLVVAV